MNRRERFYATIERRDVVRPACWLGLPDTKALDGLLEYFGAKDMDELRVMIDDDIYPVSIPHHSLVSNAIETAFDFARQGRLDREHRTLNSPGFFEDMTDPARVNDFDWPNPEAYIDSDECRAMVEDSPADRAKLGVIWSAHFQDTLAAFGIENACIQMMMALAMVHAVSENILDFYLRANEIFYESTKGKPDAVLIGNDFGGQTGLLFSPEMIREFAFPGTQRLVDQAKAYGLKVIHHSCGSIYDIIPDLIEIGVDAIHPMQVRAKDMEPEKLKREFGDRVSFVGGVDAQYNLVQKGPETIRDEVLRLKGIFSTGLVISPSHEAILADVNPANIEALFKAVHEG